MKYITTPAFDGDVGRLTEDERKLFGKAVNKFAQAADTVAADPGRTKWPKALRVKSVEGAPGIWEMTWSFSGPDGRATFEWTTINDQAAIRWRRVGGHAIFKEP